MRPGPTLFDGVLCELSYSTVVFGFQHSTDLQNAHGHRYYGALGATARSRECFARLIDQKNKNKK